LANYQRSTKYQYISAKIIEITAQDNSTLTDKAQIANTFNQFFVQAGKIIANSINPAASTPESFLPPCNAPDI
jgi:hypothetical protein